MPELPEVRRIANSVRESLMYKTFERMIFFHQRAYKLPIEDLVKIRGRYVTDVSHWGKNLLIHLDDKTRIVIHLGLGGWIRLGDEGIQSPPWHRGGKIRSTLYFNEEEFHIIDGICSGSIKLVAPSEALRGGPPVDTEEFSKEWFDLVMRLSGDKEVWSLLLDQVYFNGIGNCLRVEILGRCGIKSSIRVRDLDQENRNILFKYIKEVVDLSRRDDYSWIEYFHKKENSEGRRIKRKYYSGRYIYEVE